MSVDTTIRPVGSGRISAITLLPLLLLLASVILSGCVVQPIEAQLPLEIGAEPVPSLAIAPITGPPGTTIFVSGAGYDADHTVYVNLVIVPDEEPVQATVAIATTDAEGRFNSTFIYPLDPIWAEPGEVAVVGRSVDTGKEAAAVFLVEAATETPTPAPTPTALPSGPTPTSTSVQKPTDVAIVVSNALNVRAGPSTAYPVITTVKHGTPLKVLGQNNSGAWICVRTPSGVEGWVARAYTDFTRMAPVKPTPRPPAATPTPKPPVFTGWKSEYYNNMSLSGYPALVRNDPAVNFDWGHGSPAPGIRTDFFSARWARTTFFSGGTYRFFARSDDGVRVWVDGELVIDQWHTATGQTYSVTKKLSNGSHSVRVEYYEATQLASISVWWALEAAYPDWRGAYFSNPNLAGAPTLVRNDTSINFNWGLGSPAPNIPSDGFSAQWTRQQHFDSGVYRLHIETDDGMRVYIDGTLVIDEWREGSVRSVSRDVYINYGTRTLRVDFFEAKQYAVARFWWERVQTPEPDHFPDWKGEYWTNQHLSGNPTVVRNDPSINFNWGSGSPDSRIPSDHFSARWTRGYSFSSGVYRVYVRSDDGVRVYVNGQRIIDRWHDNSWDQTYSADISLSGWEDLKVEYYENVGGAAIKVWWEKINTTATPTPTQTQTPTSTPTGTPAPYADVVPPSGSAGTIVTVSGGGFPANTKVNVHLGGIATAASAGEQAGSIYASTVTDRAGLFTASFPIPTTWSDGTPIESGRLVILVATPNLTVEASAIFEYRAPRPTIAPAPYADVSPDSGGAGTQVTVSGGGFSPNTVVNAHLAGLVSAEGASAAAASPTSYASATTDGNGNYSLKFTMPSSWPDGSKVETGKLIVLIATDGYTQRASTTFDYFIETPKPTVKLHPDSASSGTSVTASGSGYPGNTRLNLYLGSVDAQYGGTGPENIYANVTSDGNGDYSMTFVVPGVWPDGTPITHRRLIVTIANSDFSVQNSATLKYAPAPTPTGTLTPSATPTKTPAGTATPYPNASVNPSSGGQGVQVTVSGSGFPTKRKVNVYMGAFDQSGGLADDAKQYATATTDSQGRYQASFTMPGEWPDGSRIEKGPVLVVVATNSFGVQASAIYQHDGGSATGSGGVTPTLAPKIETPEPTPTATATHTATATQTATATSTATALAKPVGSETPEVTPTKKATKTPVVTETPEVTPTKKVTTTPVATDMPTATAEPEETAEGTATSVMKPTATPDETPTATSTQTPDAEVTESPTVAPTATDEASPTATSEPPTPTTEPPTATSESPTPTPEPPTATSVPSTPTPEPPTATSVPSTPTPVPPTATSVPSTPTPEPPTAIPVPPTLTPVPPTATPTPTPIAELPTETPTLTPTLTFLQPIPDTPSPDPNTTGGGD